MKQERSRRALSSVEQEGGWPSRIGTRPSRFSKELDLCGFAIVALEDAAEFGFTTNVAFGFRNERRIKNGIIAPDTAMRPLLMIMCKGRTRSAAVNGEVEK